MENNEKPKVLKGYHTREEIKGYYGVEFYDEDGRNKNHWLSDCQIKYFLNRKDAIAYIKEVRSWNAIHFTQTLIKRY